QTLSNQCRHSRDPSICILTHIFICLRKHSKRRYLMDESAVASPSLASGRRRASSVLAAVGVAVVITLVVEVLVGYDLRSPAMSGNPPIDIGAGTVAVVAALVGLAAWALASILEPRVARPRRI